MQPHQKPVLLQCADVTLPTNPFLSISTNGSITELTSKPDYEHFVRAIGRKPVSKEIVNEAQTLADLIPNFPVRWIETYDWVAVSVVNGSDSATVIGKTFELSAEQQALLQSSTINDVISFDIGYFYLNAVSEELENRVMDFNVFVMVDQHAEYPGGLRELKHELDQSFSFDLDQQITLPATIQFTINKNGYASDIAVTGSSGNSALDDFLVESLQNMKQWKPAQLHDGTTYPQQFELTFGESGC